MLPDAMDRPPCADQHLVLLLVACKVELELLYPESPVQMRSTAVTSAVAIRGASGVSATFTDNLQETDETGPTRVR